MMNSTTVTSPGYTRPENRRRSEAWAPAEPVAFRSEAFAEDLDGPAEPAATGATGLRRPLAPAWRLWYGLAAR